VCATEAGGEDCNIVVESNRGDAEAKNCQNEKRKFFQTPSDKNGRGKNRGSEQL
jgi:hypothetical protein